MLKQMEAQEEHRLLRVQKEYLDLEIRKFHRKMLLIFHSLEQELLREVYESKIEVLGCTFYIYRLCLNAVSVVAGIKQATTPVRTGTFCASCSS